MKPSITNLVKLLIGKSAISSLYTTNMNEDRAFIIKDVKVVRGQVSVKGDNTPWLTENVVEVFNIQQNKANIEVSDALDAVSKLRPATRTGVVKFDEFDKIRDRIVAKEDVHPVGSWYYVITPKNEGFYFVKLLSGWVIFDDVKTLEGSNRQTDLLRHLFTLTYKDYSPVAMPGIDTATMSKLKEAKAYFWIPAQFVLPIKEEVVEYLRKYSSLSEKKITVAATVVISDELSNLIDQIHYKLSKENNNDFSSFLKKDIKAAFMEGGLTSTQADFAVSLIKD